MEGLIAQQAVVRGHIANHYANFLKKGASKISVELAQARIVRLRELWERFKENDIDIKDHLDANDGNVYFQSDLLYLVQEEFDEALCSYLIYIKSNTAAPPVPEKTPEPSPAFDLRSLTKSLPQIQLPKFSGKSSDWSHFRDMFLSLIHNQSIPGVVKLTYLRSYLSSEALDVIRNIPITEQNYDTAWSTLKLFYENERRLVNNHLSELFTVKPMAAETYCEVKRLLNETFTPLNALRALGRPTDYWSDMIVFMLVRNMDCNTRRDWEKSLGKHLKTPTLERIKSFLEAQALMFESVERTGKPNVLSPPTTSKKVSSATTALASVDVPKISQKKKPKPVNKCNLCNEDHTLSRCPKLKEKSPFERKAVILQKRLCLNCFGPHHVKDCGSKFTCYHCPERHHTLLHVPGREGNPGVSSTPKPSAPATTDFSATPPHGPSSSAPLSVSATPFFNGATSHVDHRSTVLLGTARVVVEGPDGKKIEVRALIDNCSQPSFISQGLRERLSLTCASTNATVSAVGGVQAVTSQTLTEFKIRPHFNSRFSCDVKALVVPRVCNYVPPQKHMVSDLLYLSHLNLADPQFLDDTEIDVLLGAEIHARIIQENIVRGKPFEPVATATSLGWLISGPIPLLNSFVSNTVSLHCTSNPIDFDLQRFWRQEELPSKVKIVHPDDEKCEEHFVQNVKRDSDGRYIVRLPFKSPEKIRIGNSYNKAVAMLRKMEARFEKDPEFKELYLAFMQDYLSSGHMIPVSREDPLFQPLDFSFFLPHHGVLKPSSSTTKLRTVFNGSSQTELKISLNNLLHIGPNLLPELPDLICGWRLYKYAFVADMKQMYRQILVSPEDRHFQAIVWRFEPSDPIQIWYLTTVTYGINSSTFQANRTLIQLAADYRDDYPQAVPILRKGRYMDDITSGGHTLSEAFEKKAQLISLLKEGGFELRKWLSNYPQLLSDLPKDHLATASEPLFETNVSVQVLGISWQAAKDSFVFQIDSQAIQGPATKRSVLSKIAKTFDPMGWIAPVIISAKIFMQSLWLLKCDWDDPLPDDYLKQWESWIEKLPAINSLCIPRFVEYTPETLICEIHGFADASEKAYAAALYLRVISASEVHCTLQIAKTRVAPLKTLSIPRLELSGAYILSKLVDHQISILPIKINAVHLWSDSRDVLFWLRGHPSQWQNFVANRCSEIQSLVPNAFWHHVKSCDNPADVASRGINPDCLADHKLWWEGPPWLTESLNPWVTAPDDLSSHQPSEIRKIKLTLVSYATNQLLSPEERIWNLFSRFSTLRKLLRVTAIVIRFVRKLYFKAVRKFVNGSFSFFPFLNLSEEASETLKPFEINNAKLLWVYHTQQAFFKEDIRNLNKPPETALNLSGPLQRLNPIIKNGLLRVGGRLNHSLLTFEQKHPLILPGDCFFSHLLIKRAHLDTLHGGVQLTLATLRLEVWLINGRKFVKKALHSCKSCVRFSHKTLNPIMGELPSDRVVPAPPFSHSGVDYAGPFSIRLTKTRGRGTMKGYVCLFVCLCTRAIHLELAEDYSSAAFIAAFHRFTARRGHCSKLYSDQGTNFVGADAELRLMFERKSPFALEVQEAFGHQGTEWKFNPPGAPHFGGIWEAGVKSTKHHLCRVVGDTVLTFSEMATLLCRIEACLNSRPLLPLSDDPTDLNYLTPSHFLIHRASFLIPEPDFSSTNVPIGRRWELIAQKMQHYWSRWRNEYLSSLQPREKWRRKTRSFQPGDVVFIRMENSPPGQWPLARVVATHPDYHGDNRVCDLRTATSRLQRPSVKLVLLVPVENQETTPTNLIVETCNLVLLQPAEGKVNPFPRTD